MQPSERLDLLAKALHDPLDLERLDSLVEGASPALQAAYQEVRATRRVFDPIVQWLGQRRDMPLTAGNLQDALEGLRDVQSAEYRFWLALAFDLQEVTVAPRRVDSEDSTFQV